MTGSRPPWHGAGHPERGFILMTSLIFLVVLTILAVSAISASTIEQRMAGNQREKERALLASNAALSQAETLMRDTRFLKCLSLLNVPSTNTGANTCDSEAGQLGVNGVNFKPLADKPTNDVYDTDFTRDAFWQNGTVHAYALPNQPGNAALGVEYRIDYLPRRSTITELYFLVTARAKDPSRNARAITQSVFEIDR